MQQGIYFYGKEGCVWCERLEGQLSMMELPYKKIMVQPDECVKIKQVTGMNTFPMLYIGETLIGGYTEFNQLVLTNKLEDLLIKNGLSIDSLF